MSFGFEDLSAEEELWFDSVLQDDGLSIARLGSSPEANEYLEQLEKAYYKYGAANIRQAHFFLEVWNRLVAAENALKEMPDHWYEADDRIWCLLTRILLDRYGDG